jgi:uncharacterized protein (DUF433 family)
MNASSSFFVLRHVSRLTDLSERQVRDWTQAGLVTPQYPSDRGRPSEHVYSFREVVVVRLIALLRERGVPLGRLRSIQPWLEEQGDRSWDGLRVWVQARGIAFEAPTPVAGTEEVALAPIVHELEHAVQRLRERAPEQIGRVTRERGVMSGTWILAGTRVPTSAIWGFHEAGYDPAAILAQYPHLEPADIGAAIAHERQLRQADAHDAA